MSGASPHLHIYDELVAPGDGSVVRAEVSGPLTLGDQLADILDTTVARHHFCLWPGVSSATPRGREAVVVSSNLRLAVTVRDCEGACPNRGEKWRLLVGPALFEDAIRDSAPFLNQMALVNSSTGLSINHQDLATVLPFRPRGAVR